MEEIFKGNINDLEFLIKLEEDSFNENRRFNNSQLKRSLTSLNQSVYIYKYKGVNVGSITLFKFKKSYRIYSIAVLKEYRKLSIGKRLLDFVISMAKENLLEKITLEVDLQNIKLINYYETFGFITKKVIKNYYGENEPALKMELALFEAIKGVKNIVVYSDYQKWFEQLKEITFVSADDFINDNKYKREEYKVFNLCSNYDYQSMGYYVSLLAQARNQRVIPNIVTIEDVLDESIVNSIKDEIEELVLKTFKNTTENEIVLQVYFGKSKELKYNSLAKALYKLFASPLLEFKFVKKKNWDLLAVSFNIENIIIDEDFINNAKEYLTQKRFYGAHFKNYKYDLAILVDEEDISAPSDKVALAKFKHAAEKKGFYTEFITKEDYHRLNQFDALFIRTTTNVNNYTYQFSRLAYAEGLVVVDDPWSILKCANKLYLHESMAINDILTPKTMFVTRNTDIKEIINKFDFPIVLKQPDSAASRGVFKINNIEELIKKLDELFLTGEIIITQQFLKTDFDWRIGVLNNEAIYACKYYMAKKHWQIYNWKNNSDKFSVGGVETFLVGDVPKKVINLALKATKIMGDGFYGVDLKEVDGEVYLIEINDNPSIDSGWEDKVLKDELYNKIISYFYEKIEESRNIKKRSTHLEKN